MKAAPHKPRGPEWGTRDSLACIMPSQTSAHLAFSDFARILSAVLIASAVSCAGTVTQPDATPVYAEEIAEGVERVEVEHLSTNRPEPENVSASENAPAAPEQEAETAPVPARENAASAETDPSSPTEVSPNQDP